MKQLFALLVVALAISCDDSRQQTVPGLPENPRYKDQDVSLSHTICYSTADKDNVVLKMNISDSAVTGTLVYNLYEKDKNLGTCEGKLYGDTLIANYHFMSEGIKSVREVAFLIKDSIAIEGFGDVEEKNGAMIFKDPKSLNFKNGLLLKKIDCE
jgi:hypothetical protein